MKHTSTFLNLLIAIAISISVSSCRLIKICLGCFVFCFCLACSAKQSENSEMMRAKNCAKEIVKFIEAPATMDSLVAIAESDNPKEAHSQFMQRENGKIFSKYNFKNKEEFDATCEKYKETPEMKSVEVDLQVAFTKVAPQLIQIRNSVKNSSDTNKANQ